MKRKVFLWNQKFLPNLQITDPEFKNRIRKVLKLTKGDDIILLNNFAEKATYRIVNPAEMSLTLLTKEKRTKKPKREIIVYSAFMKKQTLEKIVQIAAMLGAVQICFFKGQRSQYELPKIPKRFYKIIGQAQEITEWQNTPQLEIVDFQKAIDSQSYVLDQNGDDFNLVNIPNKIKVFLGPEGGWSPEERQIFREKKAKLVSLGPVNLKSEFALSVFLSLVNFPIK